jgi:hypothetical protein
MPDRFGHNARLVDQRINYLAASSWVLPPIYLRSFAASGGEFNPKNRLKRQGNGDILSSYIDFATG